MADNEDIVQRVKIVVEDTGLDKAMADKSKKLAAEMQKNLNVTIPSVRVNYDQATKAFSQVTKEAGTATKSVDKLSTAVTALNAVSTSVAAKNIAGVTKATQQATVATKQATTAQKELSKTVAATAVAQKAAVAPLQRDPNTGRMLPRGVQAPPRKVPLPPPPPPRPPSIYADTYKPPLERDPRTGRMLPRKELYGPGEFQGPRRPIGPPELQGPRLPPPPRPGDARFIGPRDQRPPLPPTDPRFIGPRRPLPSTDPNFIGPRQPIGPPPPPLGVRVGTGIGGLVAVMGTAAVAAGTLGTAIAVLSAAFEAAGNKADKAASRLGGFTGGPEQGKQAFAGVRELATTLNASAIGLAKPFEEMIRSTKGEIPQANLLNTLGNLTKSLQAEKIPEAEGQKALTDLFADIRKNDGKLTEGGIKAFEQVAPVTAKELTKSIEQISPGAIARGNVPASTVVQAAGSLQFGDDAAARKMETGAAFVQSIGEAWGKLEAAAERLSTALGGGSIIATTIDMFGKLLDSLAAAAEKLSAKAKSSIQGAMTGAAVGAVGGLVTAGPIGALVGGIGGAALGAGLGANASPEVPKGEMDEAAKAFSESAQGARQLADATQSAAKGVDNFGSIQKDLTAHSKRLSAAQAKINMDFLPQEQAIQTSRNELNVQRADIAIQSAQLGIAEAQKQSALAALAPGDAALKTQQAANTLSQIQNQQRAQRIRDLGGDPTRDPDQIRLERNANREALDLQEKAARRALERAKVEERFAHLEPAKAQLAGEQAQIALKSAQIEKQDATLKLAKDAAGQPLDRDLSALRYAQAQLDVQKEASSTLKEILAALKDGKQGKEQGQGQGQGRTVTDSSGRVLGYAGRSGIIGSDGVERINTIPGNGMVGNTPPINLIPGQVSGPGTERINTIPTPNPNDTWLLNKRSEAEPDATDATNKLRQFSDTLAQATNTTENSVKAQEFQNDATLNSGSATSAAEESMSSLPAPLDETAISAGASAEGLSEMAKQLKKMGMDPVFVGGDSPSVSAAGGGMIHGPGTTTSDSVLARLSRGEFVVKAAATKHWGSGFMHAINNMQTPRFSMGGFAGLMSPRIPRFAGGGMVDGGTSESLGSVDLRTDHGNVTVMANRGAVTQLQRMAVTKRITSTGRKPGFIG